MATNKNNNTIFIVLGLLLLVIFIGKSDFMGSTFRLTCENTEPESITFFINVIDDDLNGSMPPLDYPLNGATYTIYNTYTALGTLQIIDPGDNASCGYIVDLLHAADNTSSYVRYTYGDSPVLVSGADYLWCNKNDNVVLKAQSIATISNYYDYFQLCESVEVFEDLPTNESREEDADTNETDTSDDDDSGDDTTSSGLTSGGTSGTGYTPGTGFGSTDDDEPNEKIVYAVAGLAVLFAIYWFFERGPKKGFFRGKKK